MKRSYLTAAFSKEGKEIPVNDRLHAKRECTENQIENKKPVSAPMLILAFCAITYSFHPSAC